MIKLIKQTTIKTHRYDNDRIGSILTEVTEQYHYDSEEERYEHCNKMKSKGFSDNGQIKSNIGTLSKPEYIWFGCYYKYSSK